MTAHSEHDPLSDMLAICDRFLSPTPVALYAGVAIVDFLKHKCRAPYDRELMHVTGLVLDLPIYIDGMEDGAWEFRDADGFPIRAGRVGRPGERVVYVPLHGFIAFDPKVLAPWQ